VGRALGRLFFAGLVLTLISGCAITPPQPGQPSCWRAGAILGAMAGGAGAGFGTAALTQKEGPRIAGGFGGAIAGGLAGGLAQYYLVGCPPEAPPPPPVATPTPAPTPTPVPPKPREKIVLRGVHFDFNKAKIRPGDAAILDEAAETLKAHPSVTVNVNGYCDAIGSVEYNLKLSQRRAEAVAQYLEDHGVPESHLVPHGYGKTDFVASNDTAEGRAQNRRVELMPTE
jgi:outer membrane protein OmpA-like peptidoglycan-associated protein